MKKFTLENIIEDAFILISLILLITLGIIYTTSFSILSFFEIVSVVFGLIAAFCNFRQKRYAFIFYVIYTIIYGISCIFNKQYGEAILNLGFNLILYLFTIYKLYFKTKVNADNKFDIYSLNIKYIWIIILFIPSVTLGFGYLLKYLGSSLPFLNALGTSLALIASLFASKRIKEQWLFFLLYSIVLVIIWTYNFTNNGSSGFTYLVLNTIYMILNLYGYIIWINLYNKSKNN